MRRLKIRDDSEEEAYRFFVYDLPDSPYYDVRLFGWKTIDFVNTANPSENETVYDLHYGKGFLKDNILRHMKSKGYPMPDNISFDDEGVVRFNDLTVGSRFRFFGKTYTVSSNVGLGGCAVDEKSQYWDFHERAVVERLPISSPAHP